MPTSPRDQETLPGYNFEAQEAKERARLKRLGVRKIYLAGPMRGVPEFNAPAFHKAAYKLRERGYVVFNPAEADADRLGKDVSKEFPTGDPDDLARRYGITIRECLAEDLAWICREADELALLPGWQHSLGAMAERATAVALGLTIMELGNDF